MHWPKINRNVLKVDSEAGRPVDESINNDNGKFYHSDRLSAATCGFRLAPLLVAVCLHNRAWICKWSIFRTLGATATDQTNWANTGFFSQTDWLISMAALFTILLSIRIFIDPWGGKNIFIICENMSFIAFLLK